MASANWVRLVVFAVLALILSVEGYFTYRFYQNVYSPPEPAYVESGENIDPGSFETSVKKSSTGETTDALSPGPTVEAAFVHRASPENSRGDYTYLDDPRTNENPDAVVLVTPRLDPEGIGEGIYNAPNIGVWYESGEQKWAIFNQDLTAIPAGATFNVVVVEGARQIAHRATDENTVSSSTYIEHPAANNNPEAVLAVTQNWNPGGGNGRYNNHPIGTRYDADRDRWVIYNQDRAPIPENAVFNMSILEPSA